MKVDLEDMRLAVNVLPPIASLLQIHVRTLRQGVRIAFAHYRATVAVARHWGLVPFVLAGAAVAAYRLCMVHVLVRRGDTPALQRHLNALLDYTAPVLAPRE